MNVPADTSAGLVALFFLAPLAIVPRSVVFGPLSLAAASLCLLMEHHAICIWVFIAASFIFLASDHDNT